MAMTGDGRDGEAPLAPHEALHRARLRPTGQIGVAGRLHTAGDCTRGRLQRQQASLRIRLLALQCAHSKGAPRNPAGHGSSSGEDAEWEEGVQARSTAG